MVNIKALSCDRWRRWKLEDGTPESMRRDNSLLQAQGANIQIQPLEKELYF